MPESTLRVCALYPDLMNIYADRGNLLLLERRCAWRGIGFELTDVGLGDALDPDAQDLFYLGGGQDRDQLLVAGDLVQTKGVGSGDHVRQIGIVPALDHAACRDAEIGLQPDFTLAGVSRGGKIVSGVREGAKGA